MEAGTHGGIYIPVNMDVSRAEKSLAKFIKEVEKGEDRLTEIEAIMETISKDGTRKIDELTESEVKTLDKLGKENEMLENQVDAYKRLRDAYENWIKARTFDPQAENAQFNGGGTETVSLAQGLKESFKALAEVTAEGLDSLFRGMKPAVEGVLYTVIDIGSALGGAVLGAVKKVGSGVLNFITSPFRKAGDFIGHIGSRLNRMFQNVFMFNIMNKALREMSSYAQAVLGKNTALTQELAKMKGALYAIVQPLISLVMPVITQIAQFVTSILVSVGRLISSLTGKSWGASVAGAKSVASSMGSGAKSAKQMTKTLAGIDEINALQSDKDTSSGGGSSGGVSPSFDFSSVKSIDWSKLFFDIRQKMREWSDFLMNYDWQGLGTRLYKKLKSALKKIDFVGLVRETARLLGSAIGALAGLVWGFIKGVWEDVKAYFKPFIESATDEMGGNVVKGFFLGIADGLRGVARWIYDHIFRPFINGFKKAFGISSPSKVMKEEGQFIVDGLYEGLKGIWNKVEGIFTTLVTNIVNTFKSAWDSVRNLSNTVVSNVKSYFSNLWNSLNTVANNIKNAFVGVWNNLKSGASNAWQGIKNVFSTVASFFRDTFSNAWQAVKNVFSGVGSIAEAVKSGFVSLLNNIIAGINSAIYAPFSALQSAFNTLRWKRIAGIYPFTWLPYITVPRIPYLAQGTVVPPNREFLAMLGDNQTETEIVSPLSTMKEALLEALNEANVNSNTVVVLEGDAKTFFRVMQREAKSYTAMTGQTAF